MVDDSRPSLRIARIIIATGVCELSHPRLREASENKEVRKLYL